MNATTKPRGTFAVKNGDSMADIISHADWKWYIRITQNTNLRA